MPARKPFVLVVEDSLILALGMKAIVERLAVDVEIASSPEEAIRVVKRKRPAVAIVDLTLRKELDGLDLAKKLVGRGIKAIVCTAYAQEDLSANLPGIAAYLRKPVEADVLLPVVQAALAEPQKPT